ncbi:MAG: prepilin-type N-terminal cleavage/methylation domain-containing protein [Candidatus Aminicenantes bacterium]|nr:prepilin-type N-terminal cleavage/methylation domain-containing protein [Candidatus Aminicenantes bacterium]
MRSFFRRRAGFTLAEMTVAAAILAILAGAALPLAKTAVKREKEIELRRSLREIREAIDAYKKMADEKKIEVGEAKDGYPLTLDVLVKGVKLLAATQAAGPTAGRSEGKGEGRIIKFLRRIPVDPMTGTAVWGLLSSQDPPDATTWGEEDVYDVYTRARGTAIDGTKYRDW